MRGTPIAIEITPQGAQIFLPQTKQRVVISEVLAKTLEYMLGEIVSLQSMAHVHAKLEMGKPQLMVRSVRAVKRIKVPAKKGRK